MVSLLTLKIIFRCYTHGDILSDPAHTSPAGKEAIAWLKANELINDNHEVTDRGVAWISMIKSTPLPEQAFIDPRSNSVVEEL